ncbi:MAG TPA: hypothetical protein PLP27_09035 [Crocinitomicaceae bacterium]|nr:hypothetical protein [Crocinitomicaceae bacterium]
MGKTILALVIILFLGSTIFGQRKQDLNINFMLRGQIYAGSSIMDTTALGGFAISDNLPKKIDENLSFSDRELSLKIDTNRTTIINNKYNGYTLYIANTTDTIIELRASDSRLSVIAEVFYKEQWKPIEYLPSSWCGNSYHSVYLKQNEYWEFNIPKFRGKIHTKLRYILKLPNGKYIYSNEIYTSFNKGQLEIKQGHKSSGIMDPYND